MRIRRTSRSSARTIPVTGDVRLTLLPAACSGTKTCTFEGETEQCTLFYSVQGSTIDGVADGFRPPVPRTTATSTGDFFYDCPKKKLVGGWIECTYWTYRFDTRLNDGGEVRVRDRRQRRRRGRRQPHEEAAVSSPGPLTIDYFYNSTGGDGGAGAIDGGGRDRARAPAFGTIHRGPRRQHRPDYDPGAWNGLGGSGRLQQQWARSPTAAPSTTTSPTRATAASRRDERNFGGYGWWYAEYQHP